MAIKHSVWSLDQKCELKLCTNYKEMDIEDICYDRIEILDPDWFVIGRQVKTAYGGFIDLLCMNSGADLIVVELKRNMTPREVVAQAIDYASWADTLGSDDISRLYEEYNSGKSIDDAYKNKFGSDLQDINERNVKMILVATQIDNSTERIVRYLTTYNLNINVLLFNVFIHRNERLLSRVWLIEESEEETIKARVASKNSIPWNGEYYISFGQDDERIWDDAREYGFISAGGGTWYSNELYNLQVGNRVWVNIPRTGYVGIGEVIGSAVACESTVFNVDGIDVPFFELPNLKGNYLKNEPDDDLKEHLVKINWILTVPINEAVSESGFFGNQHIVCKPANSKWIHTLDRLKKVWNLTDERLADYMTL